MYIKIITVKWVHHRFITLKMKHCMLDFKRCNKMDCSINQSLFACKLVPLFVVASIGMGRDRQYSERLAYFTLLLCVHCTRSSTWNLKQSAGFTVPLVFFCVRTISRYIINCLLYLYLYNRCELQHLTKSCLISIDKF